MVLTVCIGSSCHLKGSQKVVEQLQELLNTHGLCDSVCLSGAFCMGSCMEGVCVRLDGELYSLRPQDTEQFFTEHVLAHA